MTPDNRNSEPLDAILRRAMRAQAGPATPECADAESLAAYSDRSLPTAERERLEAHFADCMRCQMLLADIARAEESARGAKAASEIPWYRRWRIAIPALTAVAAVLVFIALRRPAEQESQHGEVVATAKREAPAIELAEKGPAVAPASPAAESASAPAAQAPQPPAPSSNALAMNESRAKDEAANSAAPRMHHATAPSVVSPPPAAAAPAPPPVEAGRVVAIAPAAPVVEPSPAVVGQSAPVPGGLAMNQAQVETAQRAESMGYGARDLSGQAAAPGSTGMVAVPRGAAPAIAGAAVAQSETAAGSVAAGAGSGAVIGSSPAGIFSARRASAAGMGIVRIPTPDQTVWWIAGKDGMVQRHNPDSRIHVQRSGVTTDLVAGAAPSANVCWIVGRSGTIIRSTDGGERWELITAPVGDNLTRVSASSAQDATITSERGQSFVTSDGGASWHQQ